MVLQVKCIAIELLFRYLVFFTCFGIVSWQCWRCCTKFISKPQGTQLLIVNSAGNMFPSVTVCPSEDKEYESPVNSTILSNCGIKWGDYKNNAKWSNQTIE